MRPSYGLGAVAKLFTIDSQQTTTTTSASTTEKSKRLLNIEHWTFAASLWYVGREHKFNLLHTICVWLMRLTELKQRSVMCARANSQNYGCKWKIISSLFEWHKIESHSFRIFDFGLVATNVFVCVCRERDDDDAQICISILASECEREIESVAEWQKRNGNKRGMWIHETNGKNKFIVACHI